VVGEAEVGDPVGGRVGELPAAAHGGWCGGGAHGGKAERRHVSSWFVKAWRSRRRRNSKFEVATGGVSTREEMEEERRV
jgi:hypothetical protein